ncbi:unnamed protein product, partial [Sphacelaria rigidula]
ESRKRKLCSQHAEDRMVDVQHKVCSTENCSKRPSFGLTGIRKAEFYLQHVEDEVIGLRDKMCSMEGCSKQPLFGLAGSRKRDFCLQHADMIGDVEYNTYSRDGR